MVVILMRVISLLEKYALLLKEKTGDLFFRNRHRTDNKSFSRMRKIGLREVVYAMINFKTKSNALTAYEYAELAQTECATRQAFEAASQKLNASAFKELFEDSARMSLEAEDLKRFRGFIVAAIDGSVIHLPDAEVLREHYGPSTHTEGRICARISLRVDVLNGIVLDGELEAYAIGERALARRHIAKDAHEDLLDLFDRGYYSKKLAADMDNDGKKFLMRLASGNVPQVTNSKDNSGYFTVNIEKQPRTFRYFKFELSSGEKEYLATNLTHEEVPDNDLQELYHLRWGVETKYNELKNRLQLEGFSAKNVNGIEQDFYASLITLNMTGFAMMAADEKVQEKCAKKDNKYAQKPNANMAAGILKNRLIKAIVTDDPILRGRALDKLIEDISKFTIPIKPGRSSPRDKKNGKYRRRRKVKYSL